MIIDEFMMNNTLLDMGRLSVIGTHVERLKDVDAEICEVGVYKGGSARFLCKNSDRIVYLIDTFEGLPKESDKDNYHKQGQFSDTSIAHVTSVLGDLHNYKIIKQHFPHGDTSFLDNKKFKVVHVDVDLYSCVKECLEYFYPKMVDGGAIILDDYGASTCVGAKLATDEFIKDKRLQLSPGYGCSVIIIKVSDDINSYVDGGEKWEQ